MQVITENIVVLLWMNWREWKTLWLLVSVFANLSELGFSRKKTHVLNRTYLIFVFVQKNQFWLSEVTAQTTTWSRLHLLWLHWLLQSSLSSYSSCWQSYCTRGNDCMVDSTSCPYHLRQTTSTSWTRHAPFQIKWTNCHTSLNGNTHGTRSN